MRARFSGQHGGGIGSLREPNREADNELQMQTCALHLFFLRETYDECR